MRTLASRGSSRERGYSTAWDKAAAGFKKHHPRCLGCAAIGKQSRTDVVDHVEPHRGDQAKFWNVAAWQPLCRWHHDTVKKELEHRFEIGEATVADLWMNSPMAIALSKRRPARQTIGLDGWPTG